MSYDDDSDDNPCDLECVRGGGRVQERVLHEYEGPVKITLVDLLDVGFWPRVWGAALITLASLYIAGIVATMVFFSLSFTAPTAVNLHIAMCMAGELWHYLVHVLP
ncbi:unnamed protein product [Arctia plantaginis]|uniref:Uncharacterized protein n=1 Tax=Arctia plantaginis TaxID=874455 RepID=A0A8S1BFB3_ARCPL|nr:unnamed protein product [Arctia plantaginis]